MTADDVAWLQRRCTEAGIELVPNQNCFGHMERWLQHDAYRPRAETPDGFDLLPGVRRPPAVLAPTEDNAGFVLDLLDELLPLFASRRVNIGCDETFELGRGASRAEVERRGGGRVYLDHVKRIAGPLAEQGYEVQIWADMLRHDPSLADELPDGTVPIVWTYEAPVPEAARATMPPAVAAALADAGIDMGAHNGFASNLAPIAETGLPFWVAPGTSSWSSLIGRVDNATGNLLDAAEVGISAGAAGYLITDWGDNGHLQPPSISFGPLVLGGALSWCLAANRDVADDLDGVLDRWVFGPGPGPSPGADGAAAGGPSGGSSLGTTLDELGRMWRRTGQKAFNGSPLQAGVLPGGSLMVSGEPDAAKVDATIARLDAALDVIDRSTPASADGPVVRQELTSVIRLARHGAYRLLDQAGGPAPPVPVLRADLAEAIELQSDAWLARSRPGGLRDSLARLEATLATYG
jgi:hexosaminidase